VKTIGLLGGMTCESSLVYYRLINEMTRARLGGNHSAQSVMVSVDFGKVGPLMERGEWDEVLQVMIRTARDIKRGGADFLVLCTNTIHKFADTLSEQAELPILHIVDATAASIVKKGLSRIGLLGTRFTMEEQFYRDRLRRNHAMDPLIPDAGDRVEIHRIIVDELSRGIVNPSSREVYRRIIGKLAAAGAEGIVLGCTEIPLLVSQDQSDVPLFDTTAIHAQAAVDRALQA
jgi:aspartate racemase